MLKMLRMQLWSLTMSSANAQIPAAGSKAEIEAYVARVREYVGEDGVVPVQITLGGEMYKGEVPVGELKALLLGLNHFAKKETDNVG
jgi:hypothetical protein